MHKERRPLAIFTCCNPQRDHCFGTDLSTMVDHARARAEVTGYRQYIRWSGQRQQWVVSLHPATPSPPQDQGV